VLGVLAGVGAALMRGSFGEARAKGAVRSLADLMLLARTEAIRTGDNHIVFFGRDAEGNDLVGTSGQPAAALVIRDLDADGKVDAGERVASVNVDSTGSLAWGSVFAALLGGSAKAPDDNPDATFPDSDPDFICCTFLDPGGDAAHWVVFLPDGMPRAFSINPFSAGPLASGNGSVYVTSGTRDYAVVLAPLGGVRVHTWERGANTWTR
jgi:hypothetical protein